MDRLHCTDNSTNLPTYVTAVMLVGRVVVHGQELSWKYGQKHQLPFRPELILTIIAGAISGTLTSCVRWWGGTQRADCYLDCTILVSQDDPCIPAVSSTVFSLLLLSPDLV